MARTELFSRKQAGGVFTIAGIDKQAGDIYFVHAGTGTDATGYGQNPDAPVATIDYAIGLCTASKGDVIYVLPGHTETISGAGGITADVAGINIIGLGHGTNRPVITWSATASTFAISAANVTVSNIRCTSSIAAVVKLFNITGANVLLDAVDYFEDGSTDALQFVLTTAAATDLTIQNSRWYRGTTAASALSQWIVLTGADRARILNNFGILKGYATANPANSFVAVVTTACVGIQISGNRFYDSNSTGNKSILTITNTTGIISENRIGTSTTTLANGLTETSCFCFENYVTNEVAKSGVILPAADAA